MQELAVLLAVVDYKRATPLRPPSVEYLGFLSGLTINQVEAALARLKAKGLVISEPDEEGRLEIDYVGVMRAVEEYTKWRP